MNLNPSIITERARKLVGLEYIGRVGGPEIPCLWQAFLPRMHEVPRIKDTFGASHHADNGDPEAFAYLAGSEVDDFSVIPEGMKGWEVTGGLYAIVSCPSLSVIHDHIVGFCDQWLPTSGYEQNGGLLEYYPPTFPDQPEFELRFSVKERS